MPTWKDITSSEDYQSLPDDSKQRLKGLFFQQHIAPEFAGDEQWAWEKFMSTPDDTGQGLASAALNAAGRGVASIVPGVVGGLGVITGSETLEGYADDMDAAINRALPVNPALQDTWTVKGANALGNAGGFMLTGGIGGGIGKTLGAVRAGAEIASLGSGFLAGTRGGAQEADALGLVGEDRTKRALIGGITEVAAEKLLFGLGTETAAARKLMGETIEDGWMSIPKAAFTESGEEAAAQVTGNAANIAMAPSGVDTGGLLDGAGEAAVLGAIGGGGMGVVNTAIGRITADSAQESTEATPPAPQPITKPEPPPYPDLTPTNVGGVNVQYHQGAWHEKLANDTPDPANDWRMLDPSDPVDSAIIVRADAQARALVRKPSLDASSPTIPTEASPPDDPPIHQPVTTPPTTEDTASITRKNTPSKTTQLADPSGGADILTAIQKRTGTLAVTDAPEWDWYRQLQREAASSPLRHQEAEARARRGELDGDEKVTLAWLRQNGITSLDRGKSLDEAAEELRGSKEDENAPASGHSFDVDSTNMGDRILAAIQARVAARSQNDPTADLEREHIEKARSAKRGLLIASSSSEGDAFSGLRLANTLNDGDTLTIGNQSYTAAGIDADAGSLSLTDSNGVSFQMDEYDAIRVDAINGEKQKPIEANDDNAPFSLAPDAPTLASLAEAEEHLRALSGKPLKTRDGLTAIVSKATAAKMTSASASRKSENTEAHLAAITAFEPLFQTGSITESKKDRANDPNITAIHRITSSMRHGGRHYNVKFTVKEFTRQGNRIYSIEALEIKKASDAGQLVHDAKKTARETPIAADANPSLPNIRQSQTPPSPDARITAIAAGVTKTLGLKSLPERIRIVHEGETTLPDGSRRRWKGKVEKGIITLNAAELDSVEDALWNLEHELAHEAYRSSDPAIQRARAKLETALKDHPDIRAEVESLRYAEGAKLEEMTVRLAQELDSKGPWQEAWDALKEAVWNFLTGKWGNLKTDFSDRVSASLAARHLMQSARAKMETDAYQSIAALTGVRRLADGALLIPPGAMEQAHSLIAYHGTPHKVDKFSLSKIGTGEGAQAYGWGLYFAGSKETGVFYRDKLSVMKGEMSIDGVPYNGRRQDLSNDVDMLIADAWHDIKHDVKRKPALIRELRNRSKGAFKGWKQRFKDAIEKAKSDAVKITGTDGNLYTVELLPDADEFLDWDKPLSEQSEKVKAAIQSQAKDAWKTIQTWTGADYYRRYWNAGFDQDFSSAARQASDSIKALGIPGIRYLDGNSRGAGEGASNYVIFDENLVRILKENGKPVSQNNDATRYSFASNDANQEPPANVDNQPQPFQESSHEAKYHHHRSKKNVTHLLESAERATGEGHSIHFGSKRQGYTPESSEDQLSALGGEPESPPPLTEWQPANANKKGHAQPLDSPVRTPMGDRPIGSLRIGDEITSTDGQPSNITGVFHQGRKAIYKITLADGRTVRATTDHLWLSKKHWQPFGTVKDTRDLIRLLKDGQRIELPVAVAQAEVG